MKEEYYQIGDVSRITGISKDTLHFYTKIGLVTPDYINPKNLDDILERKVLNNCEDEPDINLFNRHNIPKDVINNTNKYDFLVDLTDEILTNPENIKEKIILYADYFCACVNNLLKAVYWQYGRTYFEWLNSLL